MKFSIIIPARYASSRFPGKPLVSLAGKPMLQHVYERSLQSGAKEVIIATDDARIQEAAETFGAQVIMTSTQHPSGTDRLAEVVTRLNMHDENIIVNVQGDEPLIAPENIKQVATNLFKHHDASIATLSTPIEQAEDIFNPHIVKVVTDQKGYALYFSRAPIPWNRQTFGQTPEATPLGQHSRHIGLYAYRAHFLRAYVSWPPAPIEQLEALEQLRALYNGEKIHVALASTPPAIGIDTPSDLEKVALLLS